MNEWQSFYPNFQPNQVLTSEHLNNLRRYLDEQNRLTRLRLSGMGIVSGLTTREEGSTGTVEILISEGYGITSDGYLIELHRDDTDTPLDPVTNTRYKTYTRFREYTDPARYWVAGPPGNEEQLPIYELLSEADAQALEQEGENTNDQMPELADWDTFPKVVENCHDGLFDRFIIVLYLECADESLKSCTANDCDNTGQKTNITVRALLVNPDDVIGQSQCDISLSLVNLFQMLYTPNLNTLRLPRWVKGVDQAGNSIDTITTYNEIQEGYENVIEGSGGGFSSFREALADGIELAFNRFGPFLGLLDGIDLVTPIDDDWDLFELTNRLRNDTIADSHIQYGYDFLKDLSKAYNEFIDLAIELHRESFRVDYIFCKHLQLGRVRATNTDFTRSQRNYWINSALNWNQDLRFGICQSYFIRMMLMISEFVYMDQGGGITPPLFPVKVTPSREETPELSFHSIPFYYFNLGMGRSNLFQSWAPLMASKGKWNEVLSYHASLYLPPPPDFVENPLDYNIDNFNFLRIEGVVGRNWQDVINDLESLKLRCSLPFKLVAVQLSEDITHEAVDYNAEFGDLHADYLLTKTCMIQNLMRLMDGLAFFVRILDENPPGPGEPLDMVAALNTINDLIVDVLEILEGINTDTLLEFFLDDGYAIMTGDSVFGQVREIYLDLFAEVQQFKLYGDLTRQLALVNQRWHICEIPDKINTMQLADRVTSAFEAFLSSCALPKMHVLYHLFCERWDAIKAGHGSIFKNFAAKHPGLSHRAGVEKGGTFIMVVEELNPDPTDPQGNVLADFSLPYLCCASEKTEYPEDTMITPWSRPFSVQMLTGETLVLPLEELLLVTEGPVDVSNVVLPPSPLPSGATVFFDPLYSGGPAIIYQAPSTLPTGEFLGFETIFYLPEDTLTGTKPYAEGVISILYHYPIPVIPVAVDDYASTLNQTTVVIDVLGNDCYYSDDVDMDDMLIEFISDYDMNGDPIGVGSSFTTLDGNALVEAYSYVTGGRQYVRYTPDPNFQGIDVFWYRVIHPVNGLSSTAKVSVSVIGCCCDLDPIDCSTVQDQGIDIVLPVNSNGNVADWRVYLIDPTGVRVGPGNPVGYPDSRTVNYVVTLQEDTTLDFPWTFQFDPAPNFTGEACFTYELVYKDDLQICKSEVCVHVAEAECEPVIVTLPENVYCQDIAAPTVGYSNLFYLEPAGGTLSLVNPPAGLTVNPFQQNLNGDWFFAPTDPSGVGLPLGRYEIRYELPTGEFATWETEVVGRPIASFTVSKVSQTNDNVTYRFDVLPLRSAYVDRYIWNFGDGTPNEEQSGNATFIEHTFDLVNPPAGTPPWIVGVIPEGAGCIGPVTNRTVVPIVANFAYTIVSSDLVAGNLEVQVSFTNLSTNATGLEYIWTFDDPQGNTNPNLVQPGFVSAFVHNYRPFDPAPTAGLCPRTVTLKVQDTAGNSDTLSLPIDLCLPQGTSGPGSFTGGSGPAGSVIVGSGNVVENPGTITRVDFFGPKPNPKIVEAFFSVDQAGNNLNDQFAAWEAQVMGSYFTTRDGLSKNDEFVARAVKLFDTMKGLIEDPTALRGLVRGTRDTSSATLHEDAFTELMKGISEMAGQRAAELYVEVFSLTLNSLLNTAAMREADLAVDSKILAAFSSVRGHMKKLNELNLYEPKDVANPVNLALAGAKIDAKARPNFAGALDLLIVS